MKRSNRRDCKAGWKWKDSTSTDVLNIDTTCSQSSRTCVKKHGLGISVLYEAPPVIERIIK